jgi:hypothetical protein
MDDRDKRSEELPDHEYRESEDESVGGGVMTTGGTAVDRGTGTLSGMAQGPLDEDEDAAEDDVITDTPTDVATLRDQSAER